MTRLHLLRCFVWCCGQHKDGRREGFTAAEIRRSAAVNYRAQVAQRRGHSGVVGHDAHSQHGGRIGTEARRIIEAVLVERKAAGGGGGVRSADVQLSRGGVERRDAGPTPGQWPVVGRQSHVPARQPGNHQRLLTATVNHTRI